MKFLIFILRLLSLMVAAVLLAIALTGCVLDAHAETEQIWIPLVGTDALKAYVLETDGRRLYAGGRDGVHVSDDDGFTWRATGPPHPVNVLSVYGTTVYAGTWEDGLFRSDDRGETWKPISNGVPLIFWDDGTVSYRSVKQIFAARSGLVVAVSYYHTFISTDRGENWRELKDEWTHDGRPISTYLTAITEFDNALWAGTDRHIFRSVDNGTTWQYASTDADYVVISDAIDWAVLDNQLYLAGRKGFAKYESGWTDLSRGLPPPDVIISTFYGKPLVLNTYDTNIVALAVHKGRLFAGLRRRGVYVLQERAGTWFAAGLNGLTVNSLVSHQSNLYAATREGFYRAHIQTVTPRGKAAATWGAVKQK